MSGGEVTGQWYKGRRHDDKFSESVVPAHRMSALRQIAALFDQCKSYWCNNLVCRIFSVFPQSARIVRRSAWNQKPSSSTPIALCCTRWIVGHGTGLRMPQVLCRYVYRSLAICSECLTAQWGFCTYSGFIELSRGCCVHWLERVFTVLKTVFSLSLFGHRVRTRCLLPQNSSTPAYPLDLWRNPSQVWNRLK